MAARVSFGLFLLSILGTLGVDGGANITILPLPVNLTAWKTSFREALNHSLTHPLEGIRKRFRGLVDFTRNGSVDCTAEGEECIPEIPSCCPAFTEDGDGDGIDLECLPEGDYFLCTRPSSSEELNKRFDALQYGDSMGMMDSHPWANSWAFQSRSEAEREETEIAEQEEWEKNYVPDNKENFWVTMFKKMKNSGKGFWQDIRKLKKLKEVKANLIERYKKRMDKKTKDQPLKESQLPIKDTKEEAERELLYPEEVPTEETEEVSPVSHSDETPEKSKDTHGKDKAESEESIIKFSDELPPRENKLDFRIDDIVDVVDKHFRRKGEQKDKHSKEEKGPDKYPSPSEERPFHLDYIKEREDTLIRELNKLKKLKKKRKENKGELGQNEPDIEELIKKQVAAILEEERKLDKLKKIEELKRLEEMRAQGQ